MRRLLLERLKLHARVGILEHELKEPQLLIVTLMVELPRAPLMPTSDDIDRVLDYRHLRNVALEESARGHDKLLETLTGRIVQRLLAYAQVGRAVVRVEKPAIFDDCDSVGIEVEGVNTSGFMLSGYS